MTVMMLAPVATALIAATMGGASHQQKRAGVAFASPPGMAMTPPAPASRPPASGQPDTTAAPSDSTTVNKYLSYDSADSTVHIKLVAAATGALGGLNFNGGSSGDQTITVPAGWTVDIDFLNEDAIPHSAIVIANQKPLPASPTKAAFPRAYTAHLFDGLSPQTGHDTMHFKADKSGNYLVACGVPGHAVSGMYINFVVSPTASTPTNTGTIGPP